MYVIGVNSLGRHVLLYVKMGKKCIKVLVSLLESS